MNKFVREIPKVELHLHLEGAIPIDTVFALIRKKGTEPSIRTLEDLRARLRYRDFHHFIETWIWKNSFITESSDFEEIAYQVLHSLKEQNVKYIEAFYSPGDYEHLGMTVHEITENLIRGKERAAADFGIGCELIMDVIRGDGVDKAMQRVEQVTPFLGKGVIGIGLGGSEQKYPPEPYAPVYAEAQKRGFRLTAHAGEAAGSVSIWGAIKELGIERIGHGVRAFEDPELLAYLRDTQIPLEMCAVSNLRTGVVSSIEHHPICIYFDEGLMVTVNSDDPTMFNTDISQEYLVLARDLNFTPTELKRLSLNGVEASFMPEEKKGKLKDEFEIEWKDLFEKYKIEIVS
ncbi:adenosine deaminase [candidate division WOR-3 bacterium]|nr:adenosine deaminase [candidate division WOR-3 bacterium]